MWKIYRERHKEYRKMHRKRETDKDKERKRENIQSKRVTESKDGKRNTQRTMEMKTRNQFNCKQKCDTLIH